MHVGPDSSASRPFANVEEPLRLEPSDAGRDATFRRLADANLGHAYRLARAIVGDPAEAEDAAHDAFEQAWRNWGSLRDPSRFDAWFDRILINTCRNRLRSRRRRSLADIVDHADLPGRSDAFKAVSDRDEVSRALASLDADHRIVIALRYFEDLTVDQIADRIGIPTGTVKSRLHHSIKHMSDALDRPKRGRDR